MRANVNYEGLSADQVLKIAEIMAGKLHPENQVTAVNKSFPGRASLVEEAEAAPQIQVALMFSVTEEQDLGEIQEAINQYLLEIGQAGDAEWCDLQIEDEEAILDIIKNEAAK